jgi:hypothetical protein
MDLIDPPPQPEPPPKPLGFQVKEAAARYSIRRRHLSRFTHRRIGQED